MPTRHSQELKIAGDELPGLVPDQHLNSKIQFWSGNHIIRGPIPRHLYRATSGEALKIYDAICEADIFGRGVTTITRERLHELTGASKHRIDRGIDELVLRTFITKELADDEHGFRSGLKLTLLPLSELPTPDTIKDREEELRARELRLTKAEDKLAEERDELEIDKDLLLLEKAQVISNNARGDEAAPGTVEEEVATPETTVNADGDSPEGRTDVAAANADIYQEAASPTEEEDSDPSCMIDEDDNALDDLPRDRVNYAFPLGVDGDVEQPDASDLRGYQPDGQHHDNHPTDEDIPSLSVA